jgi:hypothetical protein
MFSVFDKITGRGTSKSLAEYRFWRLGVVFSGIKGPTAQISESIIQAQVGLINTIRTEHVGGDVVHPRCISVDELGQVLCSS